MRNFCDNPLLLLQAGANINTVDKLRRTPLMEAVANNHVELARYLIKRGGCVYTKVKRQREQSFGRSMLV